MKISRQRLKVIRPPADNHPFPGRSEVENDPVYLPQCLLQFVSQFSIEGRRPALEDEMAASLPSSQTKA